MYFVYVLLCSDQTYYTGITSNIEKRIQEHQEGIHFGSYTFYRLPVTLVFYQNFTDVNQAIDFEKKIKKWNQVKKKALINGNFNQLKQLSVCQNSTHFKNK